MIIYLLYDGEKTEAVNISMENGKVIINYNTKDFDADYLKKYFEQSLFYMDKVQTPDDGFMYMAAVRDEFGKGEDSTIKLEASDDKWMVELKKYQMKKNPQGTTNTNDFANYLKNKK